jgi:hypothetical protein
MRRSILLAALALTGCSAMLNMRVSGELERPVVAFDGKRRACVDRLDVFADGARGEAVWSIEAAGKNCIRLGQIVYGELPAGFVVLTPASTLQADVVYDASAYGWTKGFASVPWIAGGAFVYRDEHWMRAD